MTESTPEQTQAKATVLVVDDDQVLRRQLFWALDGEHHVLEADSRASAIAQLQSGRVQVVLCDLHLPPDLDGISEGLAVIEAARAARPSIPVVVITGSNSRQTALEAIRSGAYGFFEKPFDEDEVTHIIRQAARVRHLEEENLRLRASLDACRGFGRLLGSSPALERIMKQARAVADTTATVLLAGENGTGKEMLARAVHEESSRGAGPFIAVSCAALPESLIESELFGHEKGAFTGATAVKKGRFELADGGTLFLDEIGELNQAVQVKLLRVLQERSFERLGGTKTLSVDIRLVAASNRDLEGEVEAGRFRRDLFYRLNVVPLQLPALRERREDLPLLAAHFAAKAAEKHGRQTPALDPALLEALQEYDWPGNVRELENLMERLVVLTTGARLDTEFLPDKMLLIHRTADAATSTTTTTTAANGEHRASEATLEGAMLALKRRLVASALNAEGGNKAAAAKRLAISRSYLHRLISELDITT